MLRTEEKMAQEIRPFLKINDSFKKIVITLDTPKPFYNDDGILMMNVYDFLLNMDSLELQESAIVEALKHFKMFQQK